VEEFETLRLSSEVPMDLVDAIEAGSQISSDESLASSKSECDGIGVFLKCVAPYHLS
jgi:hypothetical protein